MNKTQEPAARHRRPERWQADTDRPERTDWNNNDRNNNNNWNNNDRNNNNNWNNNDPMTGLPCHRVVLLFSILQMDFPLTLLFSILQMETRLLHLGIQKIKNLCNILFRHEFRCAVSCTLKLCEGDLVHTQNRFQRIR